MPCRKLFSILVRGLTATAFALLISGCAGTTKQPVVMTERSAPPPSAAALPSATPLAPAVSPNAATATPSDAVATATGSDIEAKLPSAPLSAKAVTPPAKPAATQAKAPAPASASPTTPPTATATTRSANAAAAAPVAAAGATPLDMKSLTSRLKETSAIGVFTKIALKNQVDDLLDQFRAYYAGRLKVTLAALRGPYEMLLQKVLALLQDADRSLANAIVASREAIWGILSDPAKFATI